MRSISYIINSLKQSPPRTVDIDMPMESRRRALMALGDSEHLLGSQDPVSAVPLSPLLSPAPPLDAVGRSMGEMPSVLSTPLPTGIPPSQWEVKSMVKSSNNFNHVPRISASVSVNALLDKVREHEKSGVPLIIEGWHKRPDWDHALFSMTGFVADSTQIVDVRDICKSVDIKMPLGELARHYETLMKLDQRNASGSPTYYGKDIPCPDRWEEWLRSKLPTYFHPCGDNDMISCLDSKHQPETLMCYLGIGDTHTPAHKDPCGSFGHNLMCYTAGEGSAFWFMSARGVLHTDEPAAYFHDKLGTELDLENHKATVDQFRAAPFHIYVAEQTLGDLVLVPPRSCHQVVNKGGITIKMSWSRMGLQSFDYSLHAELALYHRVCRPETYRVKLTVFSAIKHYTKVLNDMDPSAGSAASTTNTSNPAESRPLSSCRNPYLSIQPNGAEPSQKVTNITATLSSLHGFLTEILVEEWSPNHLTLKQISADGEQSLHSCDFCGADIFQSFFACSECSNGDDASEFICCPSCYVEGRSCNCGAKSMEPYQSRPFDDLLLELNRAADALNRYQPPEKRIPHFSASLIQESPHLRIFHAACLLRERILRRTNRGTRCSTRNERPTHQSATSALLQCRKCKTGMCFLHILELHNVHAAEALLAASGEADHTTWHDLHSSKSGKRKVSLSEHHDRERDVSLSQHMAWAAAKFRTCRPLDLKFRAKLGFYDKIDEPPRSNGVVQVMKSGQTLSQTAKVLEASTSKITSFTADSPLTVRELYVEKLPTLSFLQELSDLPSEDMGESSDHPTDDCDEEFLPPSSTRLSLKKHAPEDVVKAVQRQPMISTVKSIPPSVKSGPSARKKSIVASKSVPSPPKIPVVEPVHAIQSPRKASDIEPTPESSGVPAVPSTLTAEPIGDTGVTPDTRPSRRTIPYVLLPSMTRGEKRDFVPYSTMPSAPKKKVKAISLGSPAQHTLTTPESVSLPLNVRTSQAPVEPDSPLLVSPQSVRSFRPTVVPLGSSQFPNPKPHVLPRPVASTRELKPPRYGKPHRSAKRTVTPGVASQESSVSSLVPSSTQITAHLDQITILTSLLQKEQERTTTLQMRLDDAQASVIALNIKMTGMKMDNSSVRASEMHAEIARLKEELREAREESEARERREQTSLLQIERSGRERERMLEDREKQIMNLKEQLQQTQAAVAERDRNMNGVAQLACLLGSNIETVNGSSSVSLQQLVVPKASPSVATASWPTGPSWNARTSISGRGRGFDKRLMARIPQSNGFREQGREYKMHHTQSPYWNAQPFRQPVNPIHSPNRTQGRGGLTMFREGEASAKKVIYERSPEHERSVVGYQRGTERYRDGYGTGHPRRQCYKRNNFVQTWQGGHTESEHDYWRKPRSVTDSERGEGSQRYVTESFRGEGSRRARSDSDELSGAERHDNDIRSARSYSPLFRERCDHSGDGGWESFRRDGHRPPSPSSVTSPPRIETRSPSPQQDSVRYQEHRSRHCSPDLGSPSEGHRDELMDDQSTRYQDTEIIEPVEYGEGVQREQSLTEEQSNLATLFESDENPWAS